MLLNLKNIEVPDLLVKDKHYIYYIPQAHVSLKNYYKKSITLPSFPTLSFSYASVIPQMSLEPTRPSMP